MAADAPPGAHVAPDLDAPSTVEPIAESITVEAFVQRVIDREFHSLRVDPKRSDPYIEGFRCGLTKQITGKCPAMVYQSGTAAADACLAGKTEGAEFVIAPETMNRLRSILAETAS